MFDKFLAFISIIITIILSLIVSYYLNYFGIDTVSSIICLILTISPGVIVARLFISNSSKRRR